MNDDRKTQQPLKRKSFQFGLRTLFLLMLICSAVVLGYKWRQDVLKGRTKAWLLNHGGGSAVLLEDGDVVLLRKGGTYGGLVVKAQRHAPEEMEFDWSYREDGNGKVFANDAALQSGSSLTGKPASEINIHFGPFELQWSGGSHGFGWFYYPDDSAVQFCVVRKREFRTIDATSEQWQFLSKRDRPSANSASEDELDHRAGR
jgi:hypothetical protein